MEIKIFDYELSERAILEETGQTVIIQKRIHKNHPEVDTIALILYEYRIENAPANTPPGLAWECELQKLEAKKHTSLTILFAKSYEELVDEERKHQDEKWGSQTDIPPLLWLAYIIEEVGELSQAIIHTFGTGADPDPYRKGEMLKELIQIAALCKAMYENGIKMAWLKQKE